MWLWVGMRATAPGTECHSHPLIDIGIREIINFSLKEHHHHRDVSYESSNTFPQRPVKHHHHRSNDSSDGSQRRYSHDTPGEYSNLHYSCLRDNKETTWSSLSRGQWILAYKHPSFESKTGRLLVWYEGPEWYKRMSLHFGYEIISLWFGQVDQGLSYISWAVCWSWVAQAGQTMLHIWALCRLNKVNTKLWVLVS